MYAGAIEAAKSRITYLLYLKGEFVYLETSVQRRGFERASSQFFNWNKIFLRSNRLQ
jgi:hypothetical protein